MLSSIEYFKTIGDALPIQVWIIRADGVQEYFNQKWYDYVGKDFIMNQLNPGVVHPDDVAKVRSKWQQSLDTHAPFEFEYRLRNGKTKKYNWFLGKALPIRDENKKLIAWFGTSISINAEKKNRTITRGALDSLNAHIAVLDSEGVILQVNKGWEAFKRGEIGVNYLHDLKNNSHKQKVLTMYYGLKSVLERSSENFSYEYETTAGGKEQWFMMTVNPLEVEGGGAVISYLDITERIEVEIALQYSEEYNRTLVENSPDLLIVIDSTGTIQSISGDGGSFLRAQDKEHHLNKDWINFWAPRYKTKVKSTLAQALAGKKGHFQAMSMVPNGASRWWDVILSPVKDSDGTVIHVLSAARDITRLVELENQKDEFIAIVSHELKTPVTSIRTFNAALGKLSKKLQSSLAADIVGKMDIQISRLTRLITDLLDATKIQSGKLSFNMNQFVVEDIVKECIDAVQVTAENHKIISKITTQSMVYADADRVGQIIINLLTNAIKYSPDANTVVVTSEQTATRIKFCIQDFGLGISKMQQKKIFRQYYQASGNSKEKFPGLGLGLYLAAYMVKRLNGKIWVESELNNGSTFCVEFPLAKKTS